MTKQQGLTEQEAGERLSQYGENRIVASDRKEPFKIFLSQFRSPLMLIMMGAAVVSFAVGFFPEQEPHVVDVILILIIVLISGVAGFFQEYRAEKAVQALQEMATPIAKVIREGRKKEIRTPAIVPGDVVILESGDRVPADATILEHWNLQVNEAPLTGESSAVEKSLDDNLFMNTYVTSGSGVAEVVATGMDTSMGDIAGKLISVEKGRSPFQMEMADISRKIMYIVLGVLVVITAIGFIKYGGYMAVLIGISLAVAAIPAGLPVMVTLTLALGARMLARKNALVRKLAVTETLGSVNVICTDKTGTLTRNEMEVKKIFFGEKEEREADHILGDEARSLIKCGVLCNNSMIAEKEGDEAFIGDQTEVALRKLGDGTGFPKEEWDERILRKNELSFDPDRKMMSVVVEEEGKLMVYSKGAPEVLLQKCSSILMDHNGEKRPLTDTDRERILRMNEQYGAEALRVLGFGFKEMGEEGEVEKDLTWLGLQAMYDPPREEAKKALEDCRRAGIRVVMVTGDNPMTAKAIGQELGISGPRVVHGELLDQLDDQELEEELEQGVQIFARISPVHKQRILRLLQKNNVVAMTGDGVNDALAIKNADVGIAMGIKGTEVAKGSSDMILLDDNFATITEAIRYGRGMFDNIRKSINYLFTCNAAEVGVIFLSTLIVAYHEPVLLPVQILWINVMTDGLPAVALGMDPPRPGVMDMPPRKKGEALFDQKTQYMVVGVGTIMVLLLMALFFFIPGDDLLQSRSLLFTGFVLFEFIRIASIRHQEALRFFSNKWLIWALGISLLLQVIVVQTPVGGYFGVAPLGWQDWGFLLVAALIGFLFTIGYSRLVMKKESHGSG